MVLAALVRLASSLPFIPLKYFCSYTAAFLISWYLHICSSRSFRALNLFSAQRCLLNSDFCWYIRKAACMMQGCSTRDVFLSSQTCFGLGLVSDLVTGLANVPVGLDRVQVYMLFFLFRNETLIWRACSENG